MPDLLYPFKCRAAAVSDDVLHWMGRALSGDGLPQNAGSLPADAWDQALTAAAAHQLTPLLYTVLRGRPDCAPGPRLVAMKDAFQRSATRSLRMELELRGVLAALAAPGAACPCMLLKGAALGRTVYASPAERPTGDLDLLVPRSTLATAGQALVGQGYRLLGPPATGRLGRALYRYRAELAAVGTTDQNRSLLIELHWTLTEMPYYVDRIDVDEIWRGAQDLPALPGAQIPDPAVLMLHACAHLALHHSQNLRLIWLVDLDRLARWKTLDWERVIRLAEAWGLGLAVEAGLGAARRWLNTPIPASVDSALTRLAADPVGRAMWGLGDELLPGRRWLRIRASWAAFDARQRTTYAGWLALRALSRPLEWRRNRDHT